MAWTSTPPSDSGSNPEANPVQRWERKPRLRAVVMRMIIDRNPFYLISAACMLGGCLALTNSLSWLSLPLPRLLLLIGTINVYEAMLVGLAILLLGRGLLRDGKILLILEAFFLVDVTFLAAEVATANLNVGMLISAGLFALAAIKLRFIMRALGTDLSAARYVYALAQVGAMLAMPCVLKSIDQGALSPRVFYVAWWIVGLMPVVQELAVRVWGVGHAQRVPGTAAVYLVLPWISLIAHVGILHYVYDVGFYGAMATPLLLGLTLLVNRATPETRDARANLVALRVLLPLAAVLVSWNDPEALRLSLAPLSSVHVSPWLMALGGAYLTYVYCFLWSAAEFFLAAGAVTVGMWVFWPQLTGGVWRTWTWVVFVTDKIVPKTMAQWGVLSVLASFFFLIVGAGISLSAPRSDGERIK
jgi:hypothetical protein